MKVDNIGVHTSHCCKVCGCKYGDEDCPVVQGYAEAEYECEECESRLNNLVYDLNNASSDELRKLFSQLTLPTILSIRKIIRTLI